MIDDEGIYEYLEHHGVKGMRWGVRSARSSAKKTDNSSKSFKERVKKNKFTTAEKVIMAAGAAYLALHLAGKGLNKLVDNIEAAETAKGAAFASKLVDMSGRTVINLPNSAVRDVTRRAPRTALALARGG